MRAFSRLESMARWHRSKLDWKRREDNDRDTAELFFMQGSGREKKTALREEVKKNHGGSQVFGEMSERATSPLQMRTLCQV